MQAEENAKAEEREEKKKRDHNKTFRCVHLSAAAATSYEFTPNHSVMFTANAQIRFFLLVTLCFDAMRCARILPVR